VQTQVTIVGSRLPGGIAIAVTGEGTGTTAVSVRVQA
jgi:hypothetical protein